MSSFQNWISNITTSQLFPLGVTFAIAAITIVGLALIIGTRKMTEWAKEHIFQIILGLALIYGASSLIQSLVSAF